MTIAARSQAFSGRVLVAAAASRHRPTAAPWRSKGSRPVRKSSVNGSSRAMAVVTASVSMRPW